ncbi:hypothetical protein niasHT_023862 [Heterodera trifolii]|uniref:Effector protein n=1 Tax=Heterodera trifolii TaxID=157864 RepID=A0ABD2JCK2_9BILA
MFVASFCSSAFLLPSLFFIFPQIYGKMGPAQCVKSVHLHKCNSHLDFNFHCQCSSNDFSVSSSPLPSCFAALPFVRFPSEQLLTFGIAFPVMSHFLNDPEGMFLEDLQLYTFIPKECVLIYRRGCSEDGMAYEFQIGILSSKCSQFGKVPTGKPPLKTLSPLMFLRNRSFMKENPLKIAYVRKSSFPFGAQKATDRWENELLNSK